MGIFTDSRRKVCLPSAVAIFIVLLGVGAFLVFAIPAGQSLFTKSGITSLIISGVLILAGGVSLARFRPFWFDPSVSLKYKNRTASNAAFGKWRKLWPERAAEGLPVDFIDGLIIISIVLTAIATYGAMRLESKSQTSYSSQVGASFSIAGPITTASIDIAATKIPQTEWVFVDVYGLPVGPSATTE